MFSLGSKAKHVLLALRDGTAKQMLREHSSQRRIRNCNLLRVEGNAKTCLTAFFTPVKKHVSKESASQQPTSVN
jgi:hypothetical protein